VKSTSNSFLLSLQFFSVLFFQPSLPNCRVCSIFSPLTNSRRLRLSKAFYEQVLREHLFPATVFSKRTQRELCDKRRRIGGKPNSAKFAVVAAFSPGSPGVTVSFTHRAIPGPWLTLGASFIPLRFFAHVTQAARWVSMWVGQAADEQQRVPSPSQCDSLRCFILLIITLW
jgi:hypothetical protein